MEKITFQDWLDLMPIVQDRGWQAGEDHFIRDRDGRCPICALVNEIDPSIDWHQAALRAVNDLFLFHRASALFGGDVMQIVCAADFLSDPNRPALMAALGMKV